MLIKVNPGSVFTSLTNISSALDEEVDSGQAFAARAAETP